MWKPLSAVLRYCLERPGKCYVKHWGNDVLLRPLGGGGGGYGKPYLDGNRSSVAGSPIDAATVAAAHEGPQLHVLKRWRHAGCDAL